MARSAGAVSLGSRLDWFVRLVSPRVAGWQSGYAGACKALYVGSIPVPASRTARVVCYVCYVPR